MKEGLIYPELSYRLIGVAYAIFNEIGYGYKEKLYQRAFRIELAKNSIQFQEEKRVRLVYKGEIIGYYQYDFLVEDKIVVELKVRHRFGYVDIHQVLGYLKARHLELALLIYFTKEGVKFRPIINPRK